MKFFRKIHLWLSIPFGIIITLICFSGGMLIFEPEITRSIERGKYYVESDRDTVIPLGNLMEIVKTSLPDSVKITGVTIFPDNKRSYQVNLSGEHHRSIFIDQYTGKILGEYKRPEFFLTMLKLHRWLLDSGSNKSGGGKTGKLIVGISTIVFVIVLLTGIVLWAQRARRNFKKSLVISARYGRGILWRGLHVAGGMYAVIFILAMALTGLTWSFKWYKDAFYNVCGVEQTSQNSREDKKETNVISSDRKKNQDSQNQYSKEIPENRTKSERNALKEKKTALSLYSGWQNVYDTLASQNPRATEITIRPGTASVTFGSFGNTRKADIYRFNIISGETSPLISYADSADTAKLSGWIQSVHTGGWGGILTRLLWLIAALLGASLPLTGYYIWIKRTWKRKVKKLPSTQKR